MSILTVNLLFMTFVFWIASRIYVFPKLGESDPRQILIPILLLHATRHLGLMFLATGVVDPAMPAQFAYPAALGDLLAAVLAVVSIAALQSSYKIATALIWGFSVVGSADLIAAITLATIYDAAEFMGAAYWIPAFWVPALLVTHYIAFVILLRASKPAINNNEAPAISAA